jgi:hypothetical protein
MKSRIIKIKSHARRVRSRDVLSDALKLQGYTAAEIFTVLSAWALERDSIYRESASVMRKAFLT